MVFFGCNALESVHNTEMNILVIYFLLLLWFLTPDHKGWGYSRP